MDVLSASEGSKLRKMYDELGRSSDMTVEPNHHVDKNFKPIKGMYEDGGYLYEGVQGKV